MYTRKYSLFFYFHPLNCQCVNLRLGIFFSFVLEHKTIMSGHIKSRAK